MNNNNLKYYIMPVIGFIMLIINAVGYIFDLEIKNPAFTVLGLVFVIIGMQIIRKNKK